MPLVKPAGLFLRVLGCLLKNLCEPSRSEGVLWTSVSWWLNKTQQQLGLPFAVSYTSAAIRFIRVPSLDAPPFQLINWLTWQLPPTNP
jgi:hypothetical protein